MAIQLRLCQTLVVNPEDKFSHDGAHLISVDGEWADWSDWSKCSQVGDDPSVGDCLCRSRSCDNPKPYYGGQPCLGSSVEVANCTGKLQ